MHGKSLFLVSISITKTNPGHGDPSAEIRIQLKSNGNTYQYKPPAPLSSIPGLAGNTQPQQPAAGMLNTPWRRSRVQTCSAPPASASLSKMPLKKPLETILHACQKPKYKNRPDYPHKYTHMHKTRKSHSFMQAFNPTGSHLLSKVNKRIGCSMIRATQSSPKQNTTTALMRNQTTRKKRHRGRISRRQIILLRKQRQEERQLEFSVPGTPHILDSHFSGTRINILHLSPLANGTRRCAKGKGGQVSASFTITSPSPGRLWEETSPD